MQNKMGSIPKYLNFYFLKWKKNDNLETTLIIIVLMREATCL